MPLVLNEEQRMLRSAAESFFAEKSPVSALRRLRDNEDAVGFDPDLWNEMVEMGWIGGCLPQEYGGLGLGLTEAAVVMQAAGKTLAPSPMLATVVLGAGALVLAGTERQRSDLLPRIVAGQHLLALAFQEGPHHRPSRVATSATPDEGGYRITGRKVHVVDGHVADTLIVVARTAGQLEDKKGLALFLVDAESAGVQVQRRVMADSRNMAEVTLSGVSVPSEAMLGRPHDGFSVLQKVLDRGNVALAAEMLGNAEAAFDRTVSYLKTREQFGVLIGSFQVLQHRAAQMFCELELGKSAVLGALHAIDTDADDAALMSSLAKVQMSETLRLVSDEGIQMHGGIGMTDEEDIGLYLKRARVAQQLLGDEFYHVQRYAALRGY
ncbi:MAG: acyl-CoA dehydrogenase family protein [Pseudomonadota bacterium]